MTFLAFKKTYSIDKDLSAEAILIHMHDGYHVDEALAVVIRALREAISKDTDSESAILEKPYFRRSLFAINTLLSAGPTTDSKFLHRATPLLIASELECLRTIRVLMAAGFVEDGGALQSACESGNLEIVDYLMNAFGTDLRGFAANGKDTLLHVAARGINAGSSENICIVERLIAVGGDVNQKGYRDRTALFGPACENPEMIATLVAAGANVNQCCGKLRSGAELFPLHCAAAGKEALEGYYHDRGAECINLLLRLGANIDAVNPSGCSALSSAALFNNHSTLKTLLAAGARVHPKEDYDSAVSRGHDENCLVFLLAVEYDQDACNALFRTIAIDKYPTFDDLKMLVAAGADFAALDKETSLSVADEVRKSWPPDDDGMFDEETKEMLEFLAELDDAAGDLSQLDWFDAKRSKLLAARSEISAMIFERCRDDTVTVCIGLQALGLPALVMLAVIDAWHPHYHLVPMHKKWDLITGVKHFEMLEHKRKRN